MTVRRQAIVQLERRFGRPGDQVLERLRDAKRQRGRIDADAIDAIAADLGLPRAHVHGAASFYADLGFEPRGRRHVRVCAGTSCFAATGGAHIPEIERVLGIKCGQTSSDGETSLEPVYCLGYCYSSPAALDGEQPCAGIDLVAQLSGEAPARDPEIPVECRVERPVLLAGLAAQGSDPWKAWIDTLDNGSPEGVREQVLTAGLRGRGGAGFPAAQKWESAAAGDDDRPRYLICNGDEGDPGSYTDRLLMERDPQRVLAGMALAAYACGASRGYMYVRSEYPRARDLLRAAVDRARDEGRLGRDIHGSGVDFDVEVFEGAGSYVAGEETSLIHSIEGLRGAVTARPPFPTEHGLFDSPTVVNNVETLAAVPWIVEHGGEAYARLGREGSSGTELVCLNERFNRPGAYEVELGISTREIVEEIGGGLRDGHSLKALQVGGPLGGFLSPDQLDTAFEFGALERAGASLGHGSLIAIDERIAATDLLRHMWTFANNESCGTCFPCRIGCRRGHELAERVAKHGPSRAEFDRQRELLDALDSSLCAFGTSVPLAVRGIMRAYRDELEGEPA